MRSHGMDLISSLVFATLIQSPGDPVPLFRDPSVPLHQATTPSFAGTYHPSTGLRPPEAEPRSGPVVLYNNMGHSNYYTVPGVDQEFVDEGRFLNRHVDFTEQVNSASFLYCSSDPSPSGVTAVFRLYDETIVCVGPPLWPAADCSYSIPGLPGGMNGNLACWQVNLDFSGFECDLTTDPSGNRLFGFSTTWDNDATGPWISWGGLGNHNSFVWFDTTQPNRNSGFLGCYWFGAPPPLGFAQTLSGPPAETRAINAASPGAFDSLLLCVDDEVQNGNTVQYEVRDRASGVLQPAKLWVSSHQVDHHLLSGPLGLDAHLLVDYVNRSPTLGTRSSPTGIFTAALAGIPSGVYFTQAASIDATGRPMALSNALRHNIY